MALNMTCKTSAYLMVGLLTIVIYYKGLGYLGIPHWTQR
jgi:hypothetical protein